MLPFHVTLGAPLQLLVSGHLSVLAPVRNETVNIAMFVRTTEPQKTNARCDPLHRVIKGHS
jgi:hypothetical protein